MLLSTDIMSLIKFRSGIYRIIPKKDAYKQQHHTWVAFKYAYQYKEHEVSPKFFGDKIEELCVCILNIDDPGKSYVTAPDYLIKDFELSSIVTPKDHQSIVNAIEELYIKYSSLEYQLFGREYNSEKDEW